jgi:hypothetical protein
MPEEPRPEEVGPYQFVVLVFSLVLSLLAIGFLPVRSKSAD